MRKTMSKIIDAIEQGHIYLDQEITTSDLMRIGISKRTAYTFLSKHSKPSPPSKFKQYFVKISRGVYKINLDNKEIKSSLQKHPLFYYGRGLLWDHASDITGLNSLNLLDAHYLVDKKIIKYVGDDQYLLFDMRSRKCIDRIQKYNKNYFDEAKDIRRNLGILKAAKDQFDTYYGALIKYSWHKTDAETGSGYKPIYHIINKLKKSLPHKEKQLNSIYRRLNYLELITDEFSYLSERFDSDIIPILSEWITNKFETFTTVSTELALTIIEFYYDVHPKLKSLDYQDIKFIKIFDLVKDEISFFNSYTGALYIFIAVKLRNDIVHRGGHNLIKENKKFFIDFQKDIPKKDTTNLYPIFRKLIEKTVIPNISKKTTKNKWYTMGDPFYTYVSWKLRTQENKEWDTDKLKISIHIELKDYIKLITNGILYQISNALFRNLVKEINPSQKK